jgi:hypothetical protein
MSRVGQVFVLWRHSLHQQIQLFEWMVKLLRVIQFSCVLCITTGEPEFLGSVNDVNLSLVRVISPSHVAKFIALCNGEVR